MTLVHSILSRPIEFRENEIPVLTVEEPKTFRRMAGSLLAQSEGEEGPFALIDGNDLLDCGAALHVVSDFFHLQPASRKIQARFQTLLQTAAREEMGQETVSLLESLNRYLSELALKIDFPVSFEQGDYLSAILKNVGFQLSLDGLTEMEALIEHIGIYENLLQIKCFVLIGAKEYFTTEELEKLYEMAFYRKWNLMLLEASKRDALAHEYHILIDSDLCEIRLEND